ncbi:ubiquitin-conjugating enzyme E2 C-like isoform X1 [Erinaceus europaeus]|uniref:Ubiquitin-conjugating enzyme E2 C-like isoform X1 n=1 Tax=Erinaceus europaeus TaxID=9365 RepID=A0A1S3W9M6_ERIEU|nr:ubiquitin-conjugating enzyme E2 C-like isoform X1 [Erinaceus europaeus]
MDWQNRDPAASGVTAALKAAQPRGAPGPVGKRLRQERMNRIMPGDKAISAFSESDNLFKWVGTMHGAAGTIHEDLRCKLSLEFPSGHPYNTPTVKFLTACYHPSVDTQGNICLDILKDKWPALYDVRTILLCVQSLLGEPSIHSPLNTQATELWENPTAFKKYLQETCSEQVSRSPVKNPDLHCPAFHLVLSFFFFPPLDGVFFICVCIGLCL